MADPLFSPEHLAEVRAYYAPIYARAIISPIFELGVSGLILRFGIRPLWSLAGRLSARLSRTFDWMRTAPVTRVVLGAVERLWGGPGALQALGFALLHFLLVWTIGLPRAFYFGYLHERRYGLTQEAVWDWWARGLLRTALTAGAMALLAFGLFGLARRTRRWWLLLGVGAGVALMGSALLDPYRAALYFEQAPLPEGPLRARLTEVLEAAEVPFSEIQVIKTSVASERLQAVFAGQGPTRMVILNDVAVERLDPDALAVVMAHEAAHVHERRWPRYLLSFLALILLLWGAERVMQMSARRGWFSVTGPGDVRTLPLLFLLYGLVTIPVSMVSGAFGREKELAADRYALELTGDPASFRRMLMTAAVVNKMDPDPPRWVVLWAYSHPPLRERLALAPEDEVAIPDEDRPLAQPTP